MIIRLDGALRQERQRDAAVLGFVQKGWRIESQVCHGAV
jgi:hypothetical protein